MKRFAPFLFLASITLASCSGTNGVDPDIAMYQARMRMLEAEIAGVIGDAACEDSTDCRTIGFGDKPCGGPWRYLVYSSRGIDTARLDRLVTEYNGVNEKFNRAAGVISDCSLEPVPRVGIVDGRCVELPGD